jgi:hypothetical protein
MVHRTCRSKAAASQLPRLTATGQSAELASFPRDQAADRVRDVVGFGRDRAVSCLVSDVFEAGDFCGPRSERRPRRIDPSG